MTDAPARPTDLRREIDSLISDYRAAMVPRKLLVVDDDEDSAELTAHTARQIGRECDICPAPARALVKIQFTDYALVLIDLRMPQMDGVEFFDVARTIVPGMPLAFLTGFDKGEYVLEAVKRVGTALVLTKPLTVENLTRTLSCLHR